MNTEYNLCLLTAFAVSTIWLLLRLRKRKMKIGAGILGMVFAAVLGVALAKLFYVALQFGRVWPRYEWESFIQLKMAEFSIFGGGMGMVLGIVLAALVTGQDCLRFLDAFAPAGALLLAGCRYAERYQGMLGVGFLVEDGFFARFPFAVSNQWNEWFAAVFMLETVIAVLIAVIFGLRKKENRIPGLLTLRVAFYLCLAQVFCESLRAQGMRWGFVRAEQVLCGVALIVILLIHCLNIRPLRLGHFWPMLGAATCIAVIVGVEFALDKTDMSQVFWYGVMFCVLVIFSVLEEYSVRKRFRSLNASAESAA